LAVMPVPGNSRAVEEQKPDFFGGQEDVRIMLHEEEKRMLLMIVLESDDLLCHLCTESLLKLCSALPLHIQREASWVVVKVDDVNLTQYKKKIIFKKIDGFIKGNGLFLPVSIDFSPRDAHFQPGGSFLLLLNEKNRTFQMYGFPLNSERLSIVLEAILQ